jgi:hypothetical protein
VADTVSAIIATRPAPRADLPRWHLDRPSAERPAKLLDGGRFLLDAWILPALPPGRLASRVDGLTRVHLPDVERRDVIAKMLGPEGSTADPVCGYSVALPLAPVVTLGIERDGVISWLVDLRMQLP